MNKKWQIYETDTEETKRIAEKYKINELLASIIVNRKIKDEDIEKFLHPTRQNFHDPFLMPDMNIAVERIIKAIENNEKTIIYVSSLLGLTNIMNIIVEGHTDNSRRENVDNSSYNLSRTNDILYLYDSKKNETDLSYLRAVAVSSYLTNAMKIKLINIGVQNLINPYDTDALNRRVEFIIIENSSDIDIYNNYFRNN